MQKSNKFAAKNGFLKFPPKRWSIFFIPNFNDGRKEAVGWQRKKKRSIRRSKGKEEKRR